MKRSEEFEHWWANREEELDRLCLQQRMESAREVYNHQTKADRDRILGDLECRKYERAR